jgi:3-oxoacyl-[acyl-carrier-protein] synthase-1
LSLAVTGVSALTAVGDDAASTFAALRANVAGLVEHPFHELLPHDPEWDEAEPLRAGIVPTIDPEIEGPTRLVGLALGALQALVRDAKLSRSELAECAFCLALPELGPDTAPWDLARSFASELFGNAGVAPTRGVEIDQSGHTGAMVALHAAARVFAERRASRCVVLAVDSFLDAARIADWDERRRRLRSSRSRDGFLAGEGAVALLLEPAGTAARSEAPRALVALPAFGQESSPIEGERAPDGKGLTDAIRRALAPLPDVAPRTVYADHNGESHRSFEWGLAKSRLSPRLDDLVLRHPADCIGDVGAASGALLVGLAAHERDRAGTHGVDLVLTASTSGHRAAALVSDQKG